MMCIEKITKHIYVEILGPQAKNIFDKVCWLPLKAINVPGK